jgi:hypothetical protein
MRLSRPLLALTGAALAGIAMVGVGAGATFTTSTASSQKVTAGTVHVALSADGATCTSVDGSGCHALTLSDVGPVGSTFESTPTVVTMTNKGNIPVFFKAIQMSETHNADTASVALFNEMNVCIKSTDTSGTWVEGNGPLYIATALNPTVVENPVKLMPGETATYSVAFYAGQDSACGTTYSDGSHTRDAWAAAIGHGYLTPASLNNDAMGGVVTPTLTFSFTG